MFLPEQHAEISVVLAEPECIGCRLANFICVEGFLMDRVVDDSRLCFLPSVRKQLICARRCRADGSRKLGCFETMERLCVFDHEFVCRCCTTQPYKC